VPCEKCSASLLQPKAQRHSPKSAMPGFLHSNSLKLDFFSHLFTHFLANEDSEFENEM